MKDTRHLKAVLRGSAFAVPLSALQKVVQHGIIVALPQPPQGVCGILYDAGRVVSVRTITADCRAPAALQLLCCDTAYTADSVHGLITLDEAQLSQLTDMGELVIDGVPVQFPLREML